jgi:membrane protein implicated in regulation of membrane protease activity
VVYVLAMVAIIVSVDVLFLSHHFWERLIVNVGIVVVFVTFYMTFLKRRVEQPSSDGQGDPPA